MACAITSLNKIPLPDSFTPRVCAGPAPPCVGSGLRGRAALGWSLRSAVVPAWAWLTRPQSFPGDTIAKCRFLSFSVENG
jgi:hypothetical protein